MISSPSSRMQLRTICKASLPPVEMRMSPVEMDAPILL